MKVTIEINVDEQEQRQLLQVIANSAEFYNAVWELNANMRNTFKHMDWTADQWKVYDEVHTWLTGEVFDKCIQIVDTCEP